MPSGIPISPDKVELICQLYQSGKSMDLVAKIVKTSNCAVFKVLKRNNIKSRERYVFVKDKEKVDKVMLLLNERKTMTQIAKELNVHMSLLWRHVRENKIPYWKDDLGKEIVALRKEGKTIEEIARMLKISRGTVWVRQRMEKK